MLGVTVVNVERPTKLIQIMAPAYGVTSCPEARVKQSTKPIKVTFENP